jgi:hypothetical protein
LVTENTPNIFTIALKLLGITREYKKINEYVKISEVALGTHGYVISRKGAMKLLDKLYGKVNNHIDYCLQRLSSKGEIKVYCASPRLVYQTSTDTNMSTNVKSRHPKIIQEILSNIKVDRHVRANYITTLSIARIGPIHINITSILFLIMGIIMRKNKNLMLYFIILSIPDILYGGDYIVNFMLFMLPKLFTTFF